MGVLAITLHEWWQIGRECGEREDGEYDMSNLAVILELTNKYPFPSKVLEAIAPLWFKGKYYSNSYNYRKILTELDISPSMYIYAMEILVEIGILVEEEKRVYKLADDIYLFPPSDELKKIKEKLERKRNKVKK